MINNPKFACDPTLFLIRASRLIWNLFDVEQIGGSNKTSSQFPRSSHHEIEIGVVINRRTYTGVVIRELIQCHLHSTVEKFRKAHGQQYFDLNFIMILN